LGVREAGVLLHLIRANIGIKKKSAAEDFFPRRRRCTSLSVFSG